MTTIEIFFSNGEFLSIDLIHKLKRRNIEFASVQKILSSSKENNYGVKTPALRLDLEYCLLFYTLNRSDIPNEYFDYFQSLRNSEKKKAFNYLNVKYNLDLDSFDQLFLFMETNRNKIKLRLNRTRANKNIHFLKNTVHYILDTIKERFSKIGFIVTFSGVDGAGKTTIISKTKVLLEDKYRKEVILLRHRPGILPILSAIKHGSSKAEELAGTNIPRQGTNKSTFSSFLRFSYYYSDYLLGQVYVFIKYQLKGKIVLYDRYYYDFIADSKRSNIVLNKKVIEFLYLFINKPKLNIFLYAQPELIRSRKQELDTSTIYSLSDSYKKLFKKLSKKQSKTEFKIIENNQLQQSINQIETAFNKVA